MQDLIRDRFARLMRSYGRRHRLNGPARDACSASVKAQVRVLRLLKDEPQKRP